MKVIAVLNQKGGSGKTTIATHLARALQLAGADVLLVDSDPQGSARDWAAVREDQPLTVVGIDRPTIDRDVKAIGRRDFVVIDGAPQAADLAVSAIKAADFVLIPVQPSPYDIWATADLVELVKQRIEVTDGRLQAAFVVSRAIKGTRIGGEVAEALAGYELPILESRITQRVSYPGTAAAGTTVLESEPEGDAAREVQALADAKCRPSERTQQQGCNVGQPGRHASHEAGQLSVAGGGSHQAEDVRGTPRQDHYRAAI